MPQVLNGGNDFEAHVEMLRENLRYNAEVDQLSTNVFKTTNGAQTTYWIGDAKAASVSIIVDTTSHANFRKVELTSKNPSIPAGAAPFASNLYMIIKDDSSSENLVFTSDEFLSNDGEKLWNRLANSGGVVSVYDTSINQYVLKSIQNKNELSNYLGDTDKRKYLFVLSESIQEARGAIHSFAIMELKRKANWPLF